MDFTIDCVSVDAIARGHALTRFVCNLVPQASSQPQHIVDRLSQRGFGKKSTKALQKASLACSVTSP